MTAKRRRARNSRGGARRVDMPSAAPRRRRGTKTGRRRRSWLAWGLKWGVTLGLWLLIAAAAVVAYYAWDLPRVSGLPAATRQPSITVLAADGSTVASYGSQPGQPVALDALPPHVPQAVLAIEDRRFYWHFGIDPLGLARAAAANLRAGRIVQGGSTITQQLAKNLFLSPERTVRRKIQETLLALWLEYKFTKDQILTIYLNRVYLGAGTYGVDAAARKYFGRPASKLSLYQAALIAGLLKAPSRYAPTNAADLARERAGRVLESMVEAGYITGAQAKAAEAKPGEFAPSYEGGDSRRYFADWVVDQLSDYVGTADRDLVVTTTLDPRLQDIAEDKVAQMLGAEAKEANVGQAALIALSPDGAVRAMVGGADYRESQFNRATQALRQPGSAFKMFVYLAALEAGVRPGDTVRDAPVSVAGWSPENYDGDYQGRMTVAEGLIRSRNTVAVRIAERAGIDRVIDVARRLGITTPLRRELSLALGSSEVSLVELAAAYAALANNGIGAWPYAVKEVRDLDGEVIYRRSGSGPGRLIAPENVAAMNRMLAGVTARGTGRAAALDRPAAGKTGTSQDHRDAWFIGYTADLVAGVWMGNDDGTPMRRVTGGGLPARLWRAFMAEAEKGRPVRPLPGTAPPPAAPEWQTVTGAPPREAASAPRRAAARKPAVGPGFIDQVLEQLGLRR